MSQQHHPLAGQWDRFAELLLRDAVIVGLTAWLWTAVLDGGSWWLAAVVALLTTLCGFLLHEWGHLAGCLLWRCVFVLPGAPWESPFLFRFDRDANTRPQFFAMALGGFVSSIITVIFLLAVLPWNLLAAQITLALVGLGVLATLIIEVPEFLRVWRGAPIPDGAAFVSASKPR